MAMTEAPFSLTIKAGRNSDLLTGRAETSQEMLARIEELQMLRAAHEFTEQQAMQGGSTTSTPAAEPTVEQAVQNLQNAGVVENYDGRVEKKFDDKWFVWERSNAPLTNDGQQAVLQWWRKKNGTEMFSQWVHPDIATGKVRYPQSKTLWQQWTDRGYDTSDLPKLPVSA
jgi:hypothetical protein